MSQSIMRVGVRQIHVRAMEHFAVSVSAWLYTGLQ